MNASASRLRRAHIGSICLVFALAALASGVVACGEEADGTTPVCDDPGGPVEGEGGNAGAPAFRTGSSDCFTPLQSVKEAAGANTGGAGGSDAGAAGSDAGAAGSDAGAAGSDAGAAGSDAGAAGSDAGAAGSDAGAAGSS
jgi:hypothetical protein